MRRRSVMQSLHGCAAVGCQQAKQRRAPGKRALAEAFGIKHQRRAETALGLGETQT